METLNDKNPLGYESLGKLIKKFAVPSILAMLLSSLYNIVDQIFIGQGVGPLGNAATNVVFPLTSISLAISLLIGVGAASNMSILLGREDKRNASKIAGNAIWMMIILGFLYAIIAEIFLGPMIHAFGSPKDVYPYAYSYAKITLIGMPFLIINNAMGNLIRADGSPRYAMISMLVGALLNTILDPILIFSFDMGIEGAAIATVVSQIISALISIVYIWRFKRIDLNKEALKPNFKKWYYIASLGMSNSLNQIALFIVQIIMNNSLREYGAASIYGENIPLAAFGIVMKINALFIAFYVGVNQGTQPIMGYNYGAKRYDRVIETYKRAVLIDVIVGAIGLLLIELIPGIIIKIFGTSADPLYFDFARKTLRIFLSMIIAVGISFMCNNLFSSIGQPIKGIFLSLSRQLIFLVPLILILPRLMGIDGILFTGPIADALACIMGICFVSHQFRKMKNEISKLGNKNSDNVTYFNDENK